MRYATAQAFRDALEDRLSQKVQKGISIGRLRKQVVFERLLRRFQYGSPDQWILKGGFALELRLKNKARTTKDIDIDWKLDEEEAIEALLNAAQLNLDDFFEIRLERTNRSSNIGNRTQRWRAIALLAGRIFEEVIVDVDFSAQSFIDPDQLAVPPLLEFAGLKSATVPAIALEQHLAEKLHAYTRRYANNEPSSRPKDLVDMLLISDIAIFTADRLHRTVVELFNARKTHSIPSLLPRPPRSWEMPFTKLAQEVGLENSLSQAFAEAAAFLDPILANTAKGNWDPTNKKWSLGNQ